MSIQDAKPVVYFAIGSNLAICPAFSDGNVNGELVDI
jgi:hypothetical protein